MKKKLIYIEDLARKLDIQKKPLPTPPAYGWLMEEVLRQHPPSIEKERKTTRALVKT